MYKKIFLLICSMMIFMTSIGFAFEPPKPPRWIWVDSTDAQGAWIDSETLKFYKSYDYAHNGHSCVNYWVMYYTSNDNNEVIDSYDNPYSAFYDIIPNTFAETEYYILKYYKK